MNISVKDGIKAGLGWSIGTAIGGVIITAVVTPVVAWAGGKLMSMASKLSEKKAETNFEEVKE